MLLGLGLMCLTLARNMDPLVRDMAVSGAKNAAAAAMQKAVAVRITAGQLADHALYLVAPEQERAEAERAEREKAVEEELRDLRRDKTVSGYIAQCLALGYDKDLALRAAEAMADNDAATILACQQDYLDKRTKEIEAAALNKQPTLTPGAPPTAKDVDREYENQLRKYAGLPPLR